MRISDWSSDVCSSDLLAFTLSNGFTYVESYLARGMKIDDFAPNLSFFFSNGMDPEYTVIGRVARRIWAVAMKNRYGRSDEHTPELQSLMRTSYAVFCLKKTKKNNHIITKFSAN